MADSGSNHGMVVRRHSFFKANGPSEMIKIERVNSQKTSRSWLSPKKFVRPVIDRSSLERHKPRPHLKGAALMNATARNNRVMEDIIDGLLRENLDVQAALEAICARGCDEHFARDEIGRALLACLWEAQKRKITGVGPHRFEDVLRLLGNGRTTADIWPDEEG
jgi:hypothetical protein